MTTNYDDKGPINLTCPRCDEMIPDNDNPGAYPGALSRWDDATEICSHCGTEEALTQFAMRGKSDPLEVIHPTKGQRPWVHVPEGL